jgi:hypothetical protein
MAPFGGEDGLMIALNRGDQWCSDGEMVLRARRRDWSRGDQWCSDGEMVLRARRRDWSRGACGR